MNPLKMQWLVQPIQGTEHFAVVGVTKESIAAGSGLDLWVGGFLSREDAFAWLADFLLVAYRAQLEEERELTRVLAEMPARGGVH